MQMPTSSVYVKSMERFVFQPQKGFVYWFFLRDSVQAHIILASALAECFLKKLRKTNMILYEDVRKQPISKIFILAHLCWFISQAASDFVMQSDLETMDREDWPSGAELLKPLEPKAQKT